MPLEPQQQRTEDHAADGLKQLGVFAKYWEPGTVKTRLSKSLGAEQAASLYHDFLSVTLRRCESIDARRMLVYWPADRQREMAELAGASWQLQTQSPGDLGLRMRNFFRSALQGRGSRVVLVGSDSPHVPLDRIDMAFERLRKVPVVVGPSEDGGYYLLGATRLIPEIFVDIDWSSKRVWQQTQDKLRATGTPYEALPIWYDIDELSDLERLSTQLIANQDNRDNIEACDPHLKELAAKLASVTKGLG